VSVFIFSDNCAVKWLLKRARLCVCIPVVHVALLPGRLNSSHYNRTESLVPERSTFHGSMY